ncbi:MAG: AI-2E family transporter [Candidatus Magasanikbacteria bacterium]
MENVNVEITWNTLWKIFVFLGLVALLYFSRQALTVFFASVVISLGIDPIVDFLERRGINRLLATIALFLLMIISLGVGIYLIVPVVAVEIQSFISQLNQVSSELLGLGIPQNLIESFTANINKAIRFITSSSISITGTISTIFNKSVLILSTFIISFYLSLEKNGTERLLKVILPRIYEKPVLNVFSQFKKKMRVWLLAQLGLTTMVGLMTGVGLWLLGMPYALIIGIIAGVLELVPVIGPVVTGGIAFLVGLSESLTLGLYVLIFFFIVQQIENNVLVPLVMGRAMKIHPVIVIIALIAGGHIAGFVGVLLAVPIALLVQEVFNHIAEQKASRRAELEA